MALPSRAQVQTAFANAIKLIHQSYLYGSKNATNFVGLLQTFQNSPLFGDYSADAASAAQAMRSLMAGVVTRQTAQNLLRPFLRMYCTDVIGRTTLSTDQEMLAELYKYFIDNTLRVTGRGITYGSPTSVAGIIGTVQILRLTQDRFNFPIESGFLDAKRARCVLDQNSGATAGNEVWLLEGQEPPPDDLIRSGSGLTGTLTGMTADQSILSNSDFRNFTATTVVSSGVTTTPTDITDWTSAGGVSSSFYNFDNRVVNIFRVSPSNTLSNSYSLVFVGNDTLSQKLSVKNTKLNQDTPYVFAVIWNRQIGAASGTLTLKMGNTGQVVTLGSQTGWNISFCPPNRGWSNWYRNFAQNDVLASIQVSGLSGSLYVAEALWLPGVQFDGSWYWMVPSNAAAWIPPQIYDEFRWADMITGADGVNNATLAFAFSSYLPSSISSGISWPDA